MINRAMQRHPGPEGKSPTAPRPGRAPRMSQEAMCPKRKQAPPLSSSARQRISQSACARSRGPHALRACHDWRRNLGRADRSRRRRQHAICRLPAFGEHQVEPVSSSGLDALRGEIDGLKRQLATIPADIQPAGDLEKRIAALETRPAQGRRVWTRIQPRIAALEERTRPSRQPAGRNGSQPEDRRTVSSSAGSGKHPGTAPGRSCRLPYYCGNLSEGCRRSRRSVPYRA